MSRDNSFHSQPKLTLETFDITKWICALLVIFLHCSPLISYSRVANLYTTNGICRIAVPIFYGISGFLLLTEQMQWGGIYRHIKKIVRLYLIWSAAYYLMQIPFGDLAGRNISYMVTDFFFKASYYHLWYVVALVYAMPLAYIFSHHINMSTTSVWVICMLFWTLGCLHYPYYWLNVYEKLGLSRLIDRYEGLFNALFIAIPLLIAGYCSNKKYEKRELSYWVKGTLLSFVIWVLEITALFFLAPGESYLNFSLVTPIFTFYMIGFLANVKMNVKDTKILRNSSLFMYCVHPMWIYLYDKYSGGIWGIRRWLFVMTASLISSLVVCYLKCEIEKGRTRG